MLRAFLPNKQLSTIEVLCPVNCVCKVLPSISEVRSWSRWSWDVGSLLRECSCHIVSNMIDWSWPKSGLILICVWCCCCLIIVGYWKWMKLVIPTWYYTLQGVSKLLSWKKMLITLRNYQCLFSCQEFWKPCITYSVLKYK